tara:strand:- start:1263 stop:1946 length:684 start_codon:yes stop_codon:yes gene_type:complete
MIEIILMEPETSGNVGAIARVLKNFGFTNLTLINPKCKYLDLDALSRAKHAKDILKKAKIKPHSYLKNLPYLAATTAMLGNDYNLARSPVTPKELISSLKNKKGKLAILFGREGNGLTNEEINQADTIIHIPTSLKYQTLNVSQAVSILCYELSTSKPSEPFFPLATKKDKEIIEKSLFSILDSLEFATKEKKQTQKTVWKRIFGKALLTRREAFAVLGLLKKLGKK